MMGIKSSEVEGSEFVAFCQQDDIRQSKMGKRKVNFNMSPVKKSKCITKEIELSKICEEKKSVTVHGVITSLSPVKESKTKVKYF